MYFYTPGTPPSLLHTSTFFPSVFLFPCAAHHPYHLAQVVGPTRQIMPLVPCAILRKQIGGHQCLLQKQEIYQVQVIRQSN